MIKIKIDNELVFQFPNKDFSKLVIEKEENKIPSLKMETVKKLKYNPLTSLVEVTKDKEVIFLGRIIDDEPSLFRNSYICEGILGFLNDTNFKNSSEIAYNINDLIKRVVENHNSKSDFKFEYEPFKTDKTILINKGYQKSFDILTKCINEERGFFYLKGRKICFSKTPLRENNQTIKLGENLLENKIKNNYLDIKTIVVATGNKDIEVRVQNDKAIKKYGKIEDVVSFNTEDSSELRRMANEYLDSVSDEFKTLELNAVDLSYINKELNDFRLHDNVHIICKPLNVDLKMMVKRLEINILNPVENKVVFGRKILKLSDSNQLSMTVEQGKKIEEMVQNNNASYVEKEGKIYKLIVYRGEDGQAKFRLEEVK